MERNRDSWESHPKVTSKKITGDSRKKFRRLDPIPQRAVSCPQMISAAGRFSTPAR
jgi:hypothetical protein